MASPAGSHPAKKTGRFGAAATSRMLSTPRTGPVVITVRGPWWSMIRPTRIPARAETSRAAENAAVVAPVALPVAAMIWGFSTGKA
jgi:hypothetical protein